MMKKRISIGGMIALMALTAAVTVSLCYPYAMGRFNKTVADLNERQAMYQILSEIDQKVRSEYLGDIDEEKLKDGMCAGYLAGLLDAGGQYLSAEKYKEYQSGKNEKFVGVGIETVEDEDGNMLVVEVLPNTPAERGGLQKGDAIFRVDGSDVKRIGFSTAQGRLEGEIGTKVAISYLRAESSGEEEEPPAVYTVELTRNAYQAQPVRCRMLDGGVGYAVVASFEPGALEAFQQGISALLEEGMQRLIIDVRNNADGDVEEAARTLDWLLPAGNLISTVDREGEETVVYTSDAKELGLPMAVIVNDGTGGAAELFAAAIQDYKKGVLVGDTTAGRGTKDTVIQLSDGSAFILPVAYYVTPGSGIFTGSGIKPSVQVALTKDQRDQLNRRSLAEENDPQLQSAFTAVGGRLAGE